MKIPFGVFINKAGLGDDEIYDYCKADNLKILGELPFDKEVAKFYSRGEILTKRIPKYEEIFKDLLAEIKRETEVCLGRGE
jgi:MinD superfamily P-loop ATPase